jgi:zinc/manganese transport system ATP-binding protein
MNAPATLITAQNLILGYNLQHPIIQNFSAVVSSNQFIGVFGANGAGKTTFLRSLLGLIKPLSGTLTVLGHPPKQGNVQMGYMPQALPNLQAHMSGLAILSATIRGNRWGLPLLFKKDQQEIERVVALTGAGDLVNRPFMQLSGGEKRRLLLAQALLGNPRILLLDEPLANLDPHYQYLFIQLLSDIQKTLSITILLTAHDINPLIGAMTQVLYLAGGKAVMGEANNVINNEVLSTLYGSPIEVFEYQGRVFVMHSTTGQVENAHCH